MKQCRDCKKLKSLDCFLKNKGFKSGIDTLCKECNRERVKAWKKKNPEKRRAQQRRETAKNILEGKAAAKQSNYRAMKDNRTPKWANMDEIIKFYMNCPKGHHVDHIVPLRGKRVSGLHVLENLQYLTAKENLIKSNKYTGH